MMNMIINRGEAKVDNHILKGDFFLLSPSQECNIYFIIPNFYTFYMKQNRELF